jgi:hypothetical protein
LQYERLAGLGNFSGWTEAHWGALEAHDLSKVDLLGITLYPWLGAAAPEGVPSDYLQPLLARIGDTPIAITETGWPGESLGLAAPWEQSAEAQLRYLETLRGMLAGADIRILNWLYVYPLSGPGTSFEAQTFGSISLRDANGDKRPIYDAWVTFLP